MPGSGADREGRSVNVLIEIGGGHAGLGAARAKPVESGAGGDAPRPRLESARRLKARMSAMDAPEGLDREVFSGSRIADDAQNPAVDRTLMLAEEKFECIEIALLEPI